MRRHVVPPLLASMALLVLTGCAAPMPTHLIFYQSSILGVDVATSADSSTVHATMGYDRQTGTIIPKSRVKTLSEDRGAPREEVEAMSVVSRARIKVEWLAPSEICERFATGYAARYVAQNSAAHALRGESASTDTSPCKDY